MSAIALSEYFASCVAFVEYTFARRCGNTNCQSSPSNTAETSLVEDCMGSATSLTRMHRLLPAPSRSRPAMSGEQSA
jgi:hypothetical protein